MSLCVRESLTLTIRCAALCVFPLSGRCRLWHHSANWPEWQMRTVQIFTSASSFHLFNTVVCVVGDALLIWFNRKNAFKLCGWDLACPGCARYRLQLRNRNGTNPQPWCVSGCSPEAVELFLDGSFKLWQLCKDSRINFKSWETKLVWRLLLASDPPLLVVHVPVRGSVKKEEC